MEGNEIFTQEQIEAINEIVKAAFAEVTKGLTEREAATDAREAALTEKEKEAAAKEEREKLVVDTETALRNKGLPVELAGFLNCIERGTIQNDIGTISKILEDWRIDKALGNLDETGKGQSNQGNVSIRKILGLKG